MIWLVLQENRTKVYWSNLEMVRNKYIKIKNIKMKNLKLWFRNVFGKI